MKSLDELYKVWNDSQSYVAERIEEVATEVDGIKKDVQKMNANLAKLLEYIKENKGG